MSLESPSLISQTQIQIDQISRGFVSGASDWRALAAMAVGGFAYHFTKMTAMRLPGIVAKSIALNMEVLAFRSSSSLLRGEKLKGIFEAKEYASNVLDFALLKGAGKLVQGQNFILAHTVQSGTMMLGHEWGAALHLVEREEGTWAQKWVGAEIRNVQMIAGMGLMNGIATQVLVRERLSTFEVRYSEIRQLGSGVFETSQLNPLMLSKSCGVSKAFTLYTGYNIYNKFWYQHLSEITSGTVLEFSNHQKFKVSRVLSDRQSGKNSEIFAVGNQRVLRVVRHPDQEDSVRDFKGFWEGWEMLYRSSVPTIKLYKEESYFPEYMVVEEVDVEFRLDQFFDRWDQLSEIKRNHILEKLYEFAAETAEFKYIGDFHSKQVAYSPLRDSWVLIDFNDEHDKAAPNESAYNVFQTARINFGHFREVPEPVFLEINQIINRRRIERGFHPTMDPNYVPPLPPDLTVLYLLDDF